MSAKRQLTFSLELRPALGREDFFVSASNAQAVAMIDDWPDWPEAALMLVGPRGSGKTHLAEVWRGQANAKRIAADELDKAHVPELLDQGALVVEDAPGLNLDQAGLFHLLNFAREQSAHILITSRETPTHWRASLPDLQTRLNALPLAQLMEPDDDLLRAVLVKLFADRQLAVDDNVIEFLIKRMERELGMADDLVTALDQWALAEKSAITRPLAAKVLKQLAID